jgi:hypothetical protein
MKLSQFRRPLAVCVCCGCILAAPSVASPALRPVGQGSTPLNKASRTPAERKIDSQLLVEIDKRDPRSSQKNAPLLKTDVRIDGMRRALVDVRADVTPALLTAIRSLGAAIVSTSSEYRSIIAWVPLLKIKQLAGNPVVLSVMPAAKATDNH